MLMVSRLAHNQLTQVRFPTAPHADSSAIIQGHALAHYAPAHPLIKAIYMNDETQTAAAPSAWDKVESVETDMIKFETVGKVVVGVLLSRKETETKFGESPLYKIQTAEGESAFFASGILDDKLANHVGKIARIEFTETKPSTKGNDAKLFDVKVLENTDENRALVGLEAGW